MKKELAHVAFETRPVTSSHEWQVVVTWPSGRTEYVQGFINEIEAFGWIGSMRQHDWLRARSHYD